MATDLTNWQACPELLCAGCENKTSGICLLGHPSGKACFYDMLRPYHSDSGRMMRCLDSIIRADNIDGGFQNV